MKCSFGSMGPKGLDWSMSQWVLGQGRGKGPSTQALKKALQRARGSTKCPYPGDSTTFSEGENKWPIKEVLDGKWLPRVATSTSASRRWWPPSMICLKSSGVEEVTTSSESPPHFQVPFCLWLEYIKASPRYHKAHLISPNNTSLCVDSKESSQWTIQYYHQTQQKIFLNIVQYQITSHHSKGSFTGSFTF